MKTSPIISIGTSGFQYPEWRGKFYPEKLAVAEMLPFYAEEFSTTEINYSFRRIPSPTTLQNWSRLTPDRFRFSLKAPQKITHFAKLHDQQAAACHFMSVVEELGPKLGTILFQLPPTFKKDAAIFRDFLGGLPASPRVAFEFRHASWFDDEIYTVLRDARAALCLAESSTLVTPSVVTTDFGYLRLRREDYTPADLRRWSKFITAQQQHWQDTFIYFKHEDKAVGPKFAVAMKKLLI